MKWRIAINEWNLKNPPWRDAVGIEEDDLHTAVPALIGWFLRPAGLANAQHVVDLHNRDLEK